ncbi:ABC transporter substrate-binding protein [Natronobeatus ordinarius]|uniref:ABC transporter substrate-binding protein n=1 Tax=Natronobeatus ordinarius TaxID=2963433 RepID=UPI0020CF4679|nr:ABC transporter substrate-binding protein [Natronobeatus ordinarius]
MVDNATRRGFVKRTGAAAAIGSLGLAGCLGNGDDDDGDGAEAVAGETIKIGALQPVSGDLTYYGEISLMGFFSGLAYKHDTDPITDLTVGTRTIETDDGPNYEIHIQDTEFSADTAQSVATDLVVDEEVDVLVGTSSSDAARRLIGTVVEDAGVPFIAGPAADGDITVSSEHCNPLVFRTSEHTAMDARAGGTYAAEHTDISSVAIFAADYSFGHGVAANYQEVLEAEGIEVLEPRFVEQGYSEFEGLFDEALDQGADGVVGGFTVATLPQFLSTAVGYDIQVLGAFAELLTTQSMGGTIESALGEDFTAEDIRDARMGPFTTRYHWNQYDNEINDAFIDLHVDAYEMVPDLFSAGTFVAGSALSQAIAESGSTDGQDIADAMRGMTVTDTPKGENAYQFQEHNNQAASAMTVAWPVPTSDEFADTWDASVMPSEPVETLAPEAVMVPSEEASCDLS